MHTIYYKIYLPIEHTVILACTLSLTSHLQNAQMDMGQSQLTT